MSGQLKNSSREWCCLGFEAGYRNAGERGFSVLIVNDHGQTRFSIQFRAIEDDKMAQIPRDRFTNVTYMSLAAEAGMGFCPWCGSNLVQFYGDHSEDLDNSRFSISTTP